MKRHTVKTQLVVNRETHEIICTAHAEGKKHDFKLYQESIGSTVSEDRKIQGDSGYQGILALHKNSETPQKKPRGKELTDDKKMRTSVFPVSEFSLRILTLRLRCSKLRQINTVIAVNGLDCVWH